MVYSGATGALNHILPAREDCTVQGLYTYVIPVVAPVPVHQ